MLTKRSILSLYKDIAGFLVFIAVILQSGIILSNYFQGLYDNYNSGQLLWAVISRSTVGFFSSLIVAFPLIVIIKRLNIYLPWGEKTLSRIAAELIAVIVLSLLITLLVTMIIYILVGSLPTEYNESDYLLLKRTVIYSITNLLFISSLEGTIFFKEHKRSKFEEAILREKIARIKLDLLKSQINQHFMFNSLNVLSGLLKKDPEKAEIFIQEFSTIYRYVLETIEQPLAKLENELKFLKSFIYLQQIRYGKGLNYSERVSKDLVDMQVPPLSLQTVLENSIKHNIVNDSNPLLIEVFCEDSNIIVRNNFQPKISNIKSTGLGQKNIKRRYQIICEKSPEFILENGYYTAILPLIKENRVDTNLIK